MLQGLGCAVEIRYGAAISHSFAYTHADHTHFSYFLRELNTRMIWGEMWIFRDKISIIYF